MSFIPSSPDPAEDAPSTPPKPTSTSTPPPSTPRPPTTLAFTFLDDYRLDLSVRSLVGSRSRLSDVPKIAQLVESRIHAWFDERVVEPRFQQIVLPNLWPRKANTRGPAGTDDDDAAVLDDLDELGRLASTPGRTGTARGRRRSSAAVRRAEAQAGAHDRTPSRVVESSLEARMEAEGQKLREAEERAGVRPRGQPGQPGQQERDRSAELRFRPRPPPQGRMDSEERRVPGGF